MDLLHLWAVLAANLALSAAVRPPNFRQPSRPASSSSTSSLETRVSELEQTQNQLKRKVTSLTAQRDSLEERLLAIEERLATQDDMITVEQLLLESESKNRELMKMLSNFERFFGSLYAETPESFDPTEGVDVRLSKLNCYLGNREAELLSLRPAPPTVVDNATVDQELLGKALYDIEQQRSNLDRKLRRLEENLERVANRVPAHAKTQIRHGTLIDEDMWDNFATEEPAVDAGGPPVRGQSGSLGSRGNTNIRDRSKRSIDVVSSSHTYDTDTSDSTNVNNEIIDRLERLEDLMVLQLLPLVNKTFGEQSSFRTSGGSSASVLTNITQIEELEEEINALRASRPDSKKVAFSVARTTHLLGTSYAQILDFDHVFLNKGDDFNEDNSTFICAVTGYYLVSFTVRSFDGYVLGINLMKNEEPVTSVFADAHQRNVMNTQTLIVHLEAGDIMWLRHPPSERFAVHSDRYKYTTFSAFLIYKGY